MSDIEVIKVPKGIEYLSNVPAIIEKYGNDFPSNIVINKQVTGVGGSSLVLTNDVPYVLAVHLVDMIKCKVGQPDIYPNVLGVYGGVTTQDIRDYIAKGGKKIMVTYDSLPKVKEALGSKAKDFKLMVDEFHKLISYLGDFKPSVAVKLLENSNGFKSVSYLTATPTNYKYLPEPMKKLDILEFDWEAKAKPDLKHCYVKDGIVEKVLATCLDKLDNTTDELYIFYNSRSGVTSLLKKLFKCKPKLTLKDVNVLFAKSDENTKFFRKHLGKNFEYGIAPDGENNKRINVISSMGFEGIDFYPNHVTNALPTSIVVSDPNAKTMRYDINIDLIQILGRIRKNKLTGKRVYNEFIYLWNIQRENYNVTEEEFLEIVKFDREEDIGALEHAKQSHRAMIYMYRGISSGGSSNLLIDGEEIMVHPYSIEARMSGYNAMHSDSFVLNNLTKEGEVKDTSTVVTKLSNLNPELSTFVIPPLKSEYTKLLGRTPSVKKIITEYEMLVEEIEQTSGDRELWEENKDALDNFLLNNPTFAEWLNSGISTAVMHTLKLNRELISQRSSQYNLLDDNTTNIKCSLGFKVGEIYKPNYIKDKIIQVYKDLNVECGKVKATDIQRWYNIKKSSITSNGKVSTGYKIISEI